jgi:G3E family GTPase
LGDIFETDLSDADIVVSHCCTCFDEPLMQKLSDRLEKCKSGARIITITRGLSSPAFSLIGTSPCQMGWGQATINAYIRQ